MPDASLPIFPQWLKYLAIFATSNLIFALAVMAVAHASFGPMRPFNGFFIGGAAALALAVFVVFVGRYAWIAARRAKG